MSYACTTLSGWGAIPFGAGPWASGTFVGTTMPIFAPFDVFCLGPCATLSSVTLYPGVEITSNGQWAYDPSTAAVRMWSGITPLADAPVAFEVWAGVPDQFTVQWVMRFNRLPADFSDVGAYVHLGAGSSQGYVTGLAFSQVGMAFVPCPEELSAAVPLPDSAGIVEAGQTYVIKVVVSDSATYVYVTKYADYVAYGHTLRYVLAAVPASACISFDSDLSWVRIDGEDVEGLRVDVGILEFCMSTALLVTDFPPIADAGADQAAVFCSIVQLDGSASRDPEGGALQYSWRLLDAPTGSGFILEGLAGRTYPLPSPVGFTDKWYCDQLMDLAPGAILPGDILLVDGQPYEIVGLDTDGLYGTFIQVVSAVIPDNLVLQAGKVVRQFGIADRTRVRARFYPDVPGFYKFDLMVFDGAIWSPPSTTVVSVVESATARGIVPSAKFMWEYLSDFWRLVDDKGRYETVWSGLMQFCSAELLNLWQYEYNKSLRDIQRTFQRRWLYYPLRFTPNTASQRLRPVYAPYDSDMSVVSPVIGVVGTQVQVYLPSEEVIAVSFYMPSGAATLTLDHVAAQLIEALPTTFAVTVVHTDFPAQSFVRISASHSFSILSSTCPLFGVSTLRGGLHGTTGAVRWDGKAYFAGMCLSGLGISENDFLEVNGALYRILKIQTDVADTVPDSLILLKDVLAYDAGSTWSIPSYVQVGGADFHNALVSQGDDALFDVRQGWGTNGFFKFPVEGTCAEDPSILAIDVTSGNAAVFARDEISLSFLEVFRRTYTPIEEDIVDVPLLQQVLYEVQDSEVLRRNVDFFIESFRGRKSLRFDTSVWVHESDGVLVPDDYPPVGLWAEVTFFDNRPAIESNFGIPIGFTLENLASLANNGVDYLSAVRGLWYTYFNGPRVELLRIGTQILLGLPFAEVAGVIEEVRTDFSPTIGRILVRDADNTQVVRSYTYPRTLGLETNVSTGSVYAVGDSVAQFSPLVRGVELLDGLSQDWISVYAAGGGTSVLHRFFKFLLRVEYGAFNLAALTFVRDFILKVKPTYTYPIFSVLFQAPNVSSIDVDDEITFYAVFSVYDSPIEGCNTAKLLDQPEDGAESITKVPPHGPIGAPWKNSLDLSHTGSGVDWGLDTPCPLDIVEITMCTTFLVPTVPLADSVFALDLPVYDPADPGTPISWSLDVALPAGTYCRDITL